MKYFLKGAAVTVIIMIVSMVIQVFCNRKGIQVDSVISPTMSAVCAMLVYHVLTKNDKNKDDIN